MILRKSLFAFCLSVSILSLAAGYGIAGQWIGAAIAIVSGLAWLLARKFTASGLPFVCLFGLVCLAVAGLLKGSPPLLMICGSGFGLATWDLLFLEDALGCKSAEGQTKLYESKHLQSLAAAIVSGFIITLLGRLLHFQIPFMVMMVFVALVIFGFERIWGTILQRDNRNP